MKPSVDTKFSGIFAEFVAQLTVPVQIRLAFPAFIAFHSEPKNNIQRFCFIDQSKLSIHYFGEFPVLQFFKENAEFIDVFFDILPKHNR